MREHREVVRHVPETVEVEEVVCDGCGAKAPEQKPERPASKHDRVIRIYADEKGWASIGIQASPGANFAARLDLCPKCVAARLPPSRKDENR